MKPEKQHYLLQLSHCYCLEELLDEGWMKDEVSFGGLDPVRQGVLVNCLPMNIYMYESRYK
eukprot:1153597-Pelagomonas_calceolata.AAC.2